MKQQFYQIFLSDYVPFIPLLIMVMVSSISESASFVVREFIGLLALDLRSFCISQYRKNGTFYKESYKIWLYTNINFFLLLKIWIF